MDIGLTAGGRNRAYRVIVGNSPVNKRDPSGLQAESCDNSCEKKADQAYKQCIEGIDRVDNYATGICIMTAIGGAVVAGAQTGNVGIGMGVGAIGIGGCFLPDWGSIAFPTGKANCGFLRQRILDTCKAAQ